MSNSLPPHDAPLDPAAAAAVARVRRLMLISGLTTLIAVAAVFGIIGYRVFKAEESTAADMTAALPKGARILGTSLADGGLAVTIDVAGAVEVRIFDRRTLKPTGRLRFTHEP